MSKPRPLRVLGIACSLALAAAPWSAGAQAVLSEAQTLLASQGRDGDRAGASVSISGNTAVVGAPFHTDEENDQGAAYVYQRDPTTNAWTQVKQLLASDAGFDNFFGQAVAISGDFIVVGAPGNDIAFNLNQGAAYVFERNAGGTGNWGEVAVLIADLAGFGEDNTEFGAAVAIDGSSIVVGAPGLDGRDGGIFAYERVSGAWVETAAIPATNCECASEFGTAVAIHANTIVAGSPRAPSGGKAFVFERSGGSWAFQTELVGAENFRDIQYGSAVAVNGNTAAVGAKDDAFGGELEQGTVQIFDRGAGGTNAWGRVARISSSDGDEEDGFGAGVALRGDLLVATTRFVSPTDSPAYTFGRNQGGTNAWGQLQRLTRADGAQIGAAVSLASGIFGSDALIGSPSFEDAGGFVQGAATVFGNTRARPEILPELSGQIGADGGQILIASVEDDEQSVDTLALRIDGGESATSNGITVTNLVIEADGDVFADVEVACGASDASFELSFTDAGSLVSTATLEIEAAASEAPVLELGGPVGLGSPNHKYRTLGVDQLVASAVDDCDGDLAAAVVLSGITSDEPDNVPGGSDGNTIADEVIVDCRTLRLRAERDDLANGRVYGVSLRVTDSEGGTTSRVFPVAAPVESKGPAVDDGAVSGVTSDCP